MVRARAPAARLKASSAAISHRRPLSGQVAARTPRASGKGRDGKPEPGRRRHRARSSRAARRPRRKGIHPRWYRATSRRASAGARAREDRPAARQSRSAQRHEELMVARRAGQRRPEAEGRHPRRWAALACLQDKRTVRGAFARSGAVESMGGLSRCLGVSWARSAAPGSRVGTLLNTYRAPVRACWCKKEASRHGGSWPRRLTRVRHKKPRPEGCNPKRPQRRWTTCHGTLWRAVRSSSGAISRTPFRVDVSSRRSLWPLRRQYPRCRARHRSVRASGEPRRGQRARPSRARAAPGRQGRKRASTAAVVEVVLGHEVPSSGRARRNS